MILSLFRSRRFAPLFWTQFLGALNDNFFKNALILLITFGFTDLSAAQVTLLSAASSAGFILPFFLCSTLAGQLADQRDKAQMAQWVKIAEILIMTIALLGFRTNQLAILFLALVGMGIHSAFFGPIKFSILPQHLAPRELMAGNGLVEMATFLAILIGTIVAGVLMRDVAVGRQMIPLIAIALAVIGWRTSRHIPPAPSHGGTSSPAPPLVRAGKARSSLADSFPWNIPREIRLLMQLARADRVVWRAMLAISWFWAYGVMLLTIFPNLVKSFFHADAGVVTVLLAIFCVGIGIGSALCGTLSRGKITLRPVRWGICGMAVFLGDAWYVAQAYQPPHGGTLLTVTQFFALPGMGRFVVDLALLCASAGCYVVPLQTLLQHRAAPAQCSRIIAANNVLNAASMVGTTLFVMIATGAGLSLPTLLLLTAIGCGLVAVTHYASFSPPSPPRNSPAGDDRSNENRGCS